MNILDEAWPTKDAPDPISAAHAWRAQHAMEHRRRSPEQYLMAIHGIGLDQARMSLGIVEDSQPWWGRLLTWLTSR